MAIEITMPALSPTMSEGNLTKWLVKVGDDVKAGDLLAEIETDKATMEIEAVDEGKVTKLLVDEGATSIPVNSTIAILDGINGEEKNDKMEKNDEEFKKDEIYNYEDKKKAQFTKNKLVENIEINNDNKSVLNNSKKDNFKASPYAKKIAQDKNIDLNHIKGSGPDGRIIKRDLENIALKNLLDKKGEAPSAMRKIIAHRTMITKQTVPHFYLSIESNVDKLLEMRKKINKEFNVKISINDIFVKALGLAQKMNPATNVSWIDDMIVKNKSIDVSVAVALDEGLITPILKNADNKGLIKISSEIKDLVEKAKKGKLLPEEYTGGTISISNLGMFGISNFSAIINPPQSSILAVGTIKKTPHVVNDEVRVVNILKSTLSADHRVLDGAIAGKLLKDFHDIIENPFSLWLQSDDMEII